MGLFDAYQPEEAAHITKGDHRLKIIKAEIKMSQNSRQMVSLELVSVEGAKIFMTVTEGEYFNKIMTNFYDGFAIPRGNSQMEKWIGRTAMAHVDLGKPKANGNTYMEVKYFLAPAAKTAPDPYKKAETPPAANGQGNTAQSAPASRQNAPVPQKQAAYAGNAELDAAGNAGWNQGDGFKDDIF